MNSSLEELGDTKLSIGGLFNGSSAALGHERWAAVILDGIYQFVGLLTPEGDILEVNRAALDGAGHRIEEIRGKPFWTARWWQVSEKISDELKAAIKRAAAGEFVRYEVLVYGEDAGLVPIAIDFSLRPIRGESGEVEYLLPEGRKITERKRAQDELARRAAEEARSRLAAIVESSEDAIISKDLSGVVTSWNPQAERMFGYTEEEMIGRPITTIIPPELHCDEVMILGKVRNGERIEHFETVRVAKSGERIDVSLSISPVKDEQGKVVGAAKIARDIRKHKRIEHALRTTEKLAAAGRLAATVAHEVNNPLEAITNLLYLAKRDLPDADKVAVHLTAARYELDRVAHITRQTLGFYRDTTSPVPMNCGKTLDDLLQLYQKRLDARKIKIVRRFDDNAEVTAFAGEIRQAISNLLTNSMDAMPAGGTIAIGVRRTYGWHNHDAPGVRITIADNGAGITPEVRRNLFQPFFTTKAEVGTGLGLWITRGIVDKHGGLMRLRSSTGTETHGTAVSMFIPSDRNRGIQPRSLPDASAAKVSTEAIAR